jgi:hypothetical protein
MGLLLPNNIKPQQLIIKTPLISIEDPKCSNLLLATWSTWVKVPPEFKKDSCEQALMYLTRSPTEISVDFNYKYVVILCYLEEERTLKLETAKVLQINVICLDFNSLVEKLWKLIMEILMEIIIWK